MGEMRRRQASRPFAFTEQTEAQLDKQGVQ